MWVCVLDTDPAGLVGEADVVDSDVSLRALPAHALDHEVAALAREVDARLLPARVLHRLVGRV